MEGDQRVSDGSKFNMNGSYGAVKIWNQWLSFGEVSQWWGHGYDGSPDPLRRRTPGRGLHATARRPIAV